MRHLRRMKLSRNYFLDLSGGGLYRYGMLRRGVDECGAERFLFGTDYPICGPATYVGGVAQDDLLTPAEKRLILLRQRAPAVESVSRVPLRLTEREISLLKIAASPSDSLPETI